MTIDACVTLGNERETLLGADDLLRQMDRAGVERAVVQPADRALAVDHRQGNRAMLEAAAQHPDRFTAACAANPWFGKEAVQSVLDAIGGGARMLVVAPSLQGFILGDDILFPVLEAVATTRIPVYTHTGPHLHAAPWQLATVAERFPSLPFIMGHSGATDFWNDVPRATEGAPNIFLESSFARPFILRAHLDAVGIERGIMGSGAPRNDLEFEWQQMRDVFPAEQFPNLFGETMQTLIGEVQA